MSAASQHENASTLSRPAILFFGAVLGGTVLLLGVKSVSEGRAEMQTRSFELKGSPSGGTVSCPSS